MNEKSLLGRAGGVNGPRPAPRPAAAAGPRPKSPRPGLPPMRPPDKLRNPSTLSLKKSVRISRFDVAPPWEWPTSQKALILIFFSFACAYTILTMFWRYVSSASAFQTCDGGFELGTILDVGVATTRRYLSLKSISGK